MNKRIFENATTNALTICLRGLIVFKEFFVEKEIGSLLPNIEDHVVHFPDDKLLGFFYGSSQQDSSLCGVGAILILDHARIYKLWMRCGSGSNTKGELLSLWLLLHFSICISLEGINVYGDSKAIIYWASDVHNINILHLSAWLKQTRWMIGRFKNISFSHVYRKHNQLIDSLSKKTLLAMEGYYFFELWVNGSLSSKGSFESFQS